MEREREEGEEEGEEEREGKRERLCRTMKDMVKAPSRVFPVFQRLPNRTKLRKKKKKKSC